jgi:CheY-like chemotaxis protein
MSRKLLLADDSVTIQKVVQLTFADEGIEVSTAGDGDMALLKFAEVSPDIVLADVHMPGKDGYEVCESIKQGGKSVPVVLLVGSFEPFDSDKAHQVGADAFLTKPFQSIRQLVEVVSNLLAEDGHDAVSGAAAAAGAEEDGDDQEFVDTHEIPQEEMAAELGDSGMDDEMIETTPAESLLPDSTVDAGDETPWRAENEGPASFVSDYRETTAALDDLPAYDRSVEAAGYEIAEEPLDVHAADTLREGSFPQYQAAGDISTEEDNAGGDETGPGSYEAENREDLRPGTAHGFEIVPSGPPAYEAPNPYTPPPMDDSNLLEIPWSVGGARSVKETPAAPPVQETASPESSPEFIEAVTERVMEKMTDDFFKNLVREIVPLVVREIAEDRSEN